MIEQGSSPRRIKLVLVFTAILVLAMVVQLVRVQFGPYAPAFAAIESVIAEQVDKVEPARGLIYDRDGRLLASNIPMYYLEVEVRQLTDSSKKQISAVLSRVLVLPFEDLYAQLTHKWVDDGQFRIRITREIPGDKRWPILVDQIVADVLKGFLADPEAPDLSGLALVPAPSRTYPAGWLAGHVLGFVNQKGKGYFGIEGYYDEWLIGKSITVERGYIPLEARLKPDPPAGVNLVLTIDIDIQHMVEKILEQAIEDTKSESGQVIVMDPSNGEILAMASWPPLDPNHYEPWLPREERQYEQVEENEEELVINPAVAGQFEPGSTFKILTMAAALDAGVITPDEEFIDTGMIEVGGNTIRNWDGGAWGPQTMVGCIEHSLNVCLAYVASERLGTSLFYDYLKDFGVGRLTGIDLAGEVPGQLRTPRHPNWTESDLGTNSFGQGVSVTPIQLLTAVGAVANGGIMVQPHVVRAVVGPEGVYWPKTTILGRPISAETAETLSQMLSISLEGETHFAQVDEYRMVGKTGTAQIATEYGYDPRWTVASFVGWGPLVDPSLLVLVRLDKPEISPWGSVVAAPVFRQIVERLVVMMEIPPDQIREMWTGGG
ncbi:MAG: penicillin-binding protein 2 [Anaerolineales bacterium]|nr:penicillin-binding protein 2 [Anaerolineales bacterium]